MSYEVDGVEVGGPKPEWASGDNFVLPQDVKTVIYPDDVRVTDGQHGGLISADSAAQGGVQNDNGELGLALPAAPAAEEQPAAPVEAPATPDVGGSEPPVVEPPAAPAQ